MAPKLVQSPSNNMSDASSVRSTTASGDAGKEGSFEEDELSREEAFTVFWTDKAFHDVTLEGSDGALVSANSYALAARSKVFRKLLLQGEEPVVKIPYSGAVLRAVVEYLHTDTARLLEQADGYEGGNVTEGVLKHFQSLLSLASAAFNDFLNLPYLYEKTESCCVKLLETYPALSFAAIETFHQETANAPAKIVTLSFANLRTKNAIDVHSNASAVTVLSADALRLILADDRLEMGAKQIFELLHVWSGLDSDSQAEKPGQDSCVSDDRQAQAAAMLRQYVDLSLIPPTVLSRDVAPTALARTEDLAKAYEAQALSAMLDHGVAFDKPIDTICNAKNQLEATKRELTQTEKFLVERHLELEQAQKQLSSIQEKNQETEESLRQALARLTNTQAELRKLEGGVATAKQEQHKLLENFYCEKIDCEELPVWTLSGSTAIRVSFREHKNEFLKGCPPMKSGGVYKWTISVSEGHRLVHVGIADPIYANLNQHEAKYVRNLPSTWTYFGSSGRAYHGGKMRHTRQLKCLQSGSCQVTFVLNLLPEGPKAGTLSIRVDGGDFVELFDELGKGSEEEGFIPIVSYYHPGTEFQLLSYNRLM